MTERVSGFMTDDGQFFRYEHEAIYYETRLELQKRMENNVRLTILSRADFSEIIDFIENEYLVIANFVDAVKGMPNAENHEQEPLADEDKASPA